MNEFKTQFKNQTDNIMMSKQKNPTELVIISLNYKVKLQTA